MRGRTLLTSAGAAVLIGSVVTPASAAPDLVAPSGVSPAAAGAGVERLLRDVRRLTSPRDLGVPGRASPMMVSGSGVVVGQTWTDEGTRFFRWEATTGVALLPDPGQVGTSPTILPAAVNDRGEIVGHSAGRPVMWRPDGTVVDLAPDAPDRTVWPTGVNAHGLVVASVLRPLSSHAAVVRDGEVTVIADLGASSGVAERDGVNDRGEVTGTAYDERWRRHAFVWRDGDLRILPAPEGADAEGLAINARGDVLGRIHHAGTYQLVVWEAGGGVRHLDPDGGTRIRPTGLSDTGVVVGNIEVRDGPSLAVVMDARGRRSLATAGAGSTAAVGVHHGALVSGWTERSGDALRQPAVWVHGALVPLGTGLGGEVALGGEVLAVTRDGTAVGHLVARDGGLRTVVWDLTPW